MASLLPGYEYDIFISYRQKDNKHDGWVTEFVNNLKGELESTFKEEISVYFDISPHDGLLETYDVDASLKEKLKCLIFIPIISLTYCDPKSFAWEHEFKAFGEQASRDQFGMKVKLSRGNVASRVLPIQIHELDSDDRKLVESELGGFLRGIEFIYKEPGVNRPLTPNDDEKKNLSNTMYKNQINKVANAIKEIITGLKNPDREGKGILKGINEEKPSLRKNLKTKIIAGTGILFALIVLGYFIIPKLIKPKEQLEKSIAVLPFKLLSDEPDKQYLADGMMDAIKLHLSKIEDLRVKSRASVEQYRNSDKTIQEIGKDLGAEYLLEGSFQKSGDNVRLIVQLIYARNDDQIWSGEYDRNWKNIFSVQSDVAQIIAKELHTIITPAEKQLIEKIPTANLTAYDLYLKANDYQKYYQETQNLSSYLKSVTFYKAALGIDSTFAKAYTGLATAYALRYYYETYFKKNYLDSCLSLVNKALIFDNQLDEAYYIKGQYYRLNGYLEEALDNLDKALIINPNYYLAYNAKGYTLTFILKDFVKGIDNYQKALNLISGVERRNLLSNLGRAYLDIGFIDKAKYYYLEACEQEKDSATYFGNLAWVEFNVESFEEALKLAKKARGLDSAILIPQDFYICLPPTYKDEAYLNAKERIERYKKSGALNLQGSHRVGYTFWQVGKKKEAEYYFKQQIKYGEESINLGRDIAQKKAAQYDLAATYAFLGKKEIAYKYLHEFSKMNTYPLWWIVLIKNDPLFINIRNETKFQQIVKDVEAKYQAEHERVRKWLEEQGML
jgi:TolB-like protein/Tfp pilus assembly protein PilF